MGLAAWGCLLVDWFVVGVAMHAFVRHNRQLDADLVTVTVAGAELGLVLVAVHCDISSFRFVFVWFFLFYSGGWLTYLYVIVSYEKQIFVSRTSFISMWQAASIKILIRRSVAADVVVVLIADFGGAADVWSQSNSNVVSDGWSNEPRAEAQTAGWRSEV